MAARNNNTTPASSSLRTDSLCDERLWRMVDANINRLLEGLRACEDVVRFYFGDRSCGVWKKMRSQVWACPWTRDQIHRLRSRDSQADCGYDQPSRHEGCRDSVADVFFANAQRVKEAARVLEELAKLWDSDEAQRFKALRYQVYAIEKDLGLRFMRPEQEKRHTKKRKGRQA